MPQAFPITPSNHNIAIEAVLTASEGHTVTFTRKITITNQRTRGRAIELAQKLKVGWRLSIGKQTRSQQQNAKLWCLLTDLSIAKPEGRMHTPDVWKHLVMHACGHDVQFEIGLDGKPFPTGFRSSKLTVGQMSDLIEWIYAYGAEHNVQWSEPEQQQTQAA